MTAKLAVAAATCTLAWVAAAFGTNTVEVGEGALSPQEAILKIREAKRSGDKSAWVVQVKGGRHLLTEPIVLEPEDSGTPDAPVLWDGGGGFYDEAFFVGGAELKGWKELGGGVYETDAPRDRDGNLIWFESLFEHRFRRLKRARMPNDGFYTFAEVKSVEVKDPVTGEIRHLRKCRGCGGDLDFLSGLTKEELAHSTLDVRRKDRNDRFPIESYDPATRTLTVDVGRRDEPDFAWDADCLYAVENVRTAFDEDGEWFYDWKAGKIRCRESDADEFEENVKEHLVAPLAGLEQLVIIKGRPEKGEFVHDISFADLFFAYSASPADGPGRSPMRHYGTVAASDAGAAILADGAMRVRFERCRVWSTGGYGAWLRDGCVSNEFVDCTFNDLGAGGVKIGSCGSPTAFNRVVECRITDGGRVDAAGVGVLVAQASDSEIARCEIRNLYGTGVSVGWPRTGDGEIARRNKVAFNKIRNIGQGELSGISGICACGESFGTLISGNVVENVDACSFGGWGLFADGGVQDAVFENNEVKNTKDGSFCQRYGANCILRNNKLLYNKEKGAIFAERTGTNGAKSSLGVISNTVVTAGAPLVWKGVFNVEGEWLGNIWKDEKGEADFGGMTVDEWVRAGKETGGHLDIQAASSLGETVPDGTILVGTTGYGKSPEAQDIMANDSANLWVQSERGEYLLPESMGDEWTAWAKKNGIRLMTVAGRHDASVTKRLREAWGPLYLGDGIGEFAEFLYKDERGGEKSRPQCGNLREARDWFVNEFMSELAGRGASRPAEEREPHLFPASGAPLACYVRDGGFDFACSHMYAAGCANLAYATAEARGAARLRGKSWWGAWLSHEWQTCWLRVPYAVPQKQDSLETGLKEMWLMGTSMMVLESGSQSTQAHDYTPPDGDMKEFQSEKQGFDGDVPKAYRKTMGDFYKWTKAHPRAKGLPEVRAALVIGNLDGYAGMTDDKIAIFGQHHLAKTNANWRVGAPEFTWEAMMETFFPRPDDALRPFANGWLGGTPHGQVDVVNIDDSSKAEDLAKYDVLVFGGWNTMTEKIAAALREYATGGGQVVLCVPQLSRRIDREYSNYTAEDLVQAVPGVTVKEPYLAADILMSSLYPAHVFAKMRVADVELGDDVEVAATMGKRPYLVKAPCGKGAFWLSLAWDYPAARREFENFPSYRNARLDFWKTLSVSLVESVQPCHAEGADAKYISWAVWKDRIYLLNTDCVGRRSIVFRGKTIEFEPKEMKELVR